MRNPEFEGIRKEIWSMMVEHPLQGSYEAVLRGEKSWKEYHEDLLKYLKSGEEEPAYFALEHVLDALRKRHKSTYQDEFWEVAERITTYYPPQDTSIAPEYLARIHQAAIQLARNSKAITKKPIFWRTLLGTAVVDMLPPKVVEDTAKAIRHTIREGHARNDEKLAKVLRVVAEDLAEQIQFVKDHKNLKNSELKQLWSAEEQLSIARRLLEKQKHTRT